MSARSRSVKKARQLGRSHGDAHVAVAGRKMPGVGSVAFVEWNAGIRPVAALQQHPFAIDHDDFFVGIRKIAESAMGRERRRDGRFDPALPQVAEDLRFRTRAIGIEQQGDPHAALQGPLQQGFRGGEQ